MITTIDFVRIGVIAVAVGMIDTKSIVVIIITLPSNHLIQVLLQHPSH